MNDRNSDSHLAELELISRINSAMIEGQPLQGILATATRSVKEMLSYDACNVYLVDEDRKCLKYISVSTDMEIIGKAMDLIGMKFDEFTVPLREGTSFSDVVSRGQVVVMKDMRKAFEDYTDIPALKVLASSVAALFGFQTIARLPLAADGAILGVLGVGRRAAISEEDIAQLKRISTAISLTIKKSLTDQKTRKANDELMLLKRAIETAPLGVTISDPAGTIVFTNSAEAEMHGYAVGELLGEHVSIFNPAAKGKQAYRKDIAWKPWTREVVATRKNGTTFNQELTSTAIRNSNGELVGVVSVSRDITERKQIEGKLQLAAKFLQATSEAVVITDAEAVIIDVNDAFERLTGYTKGEVVGKNPRIMKSDRHDKEFYVQMWRSITETGQWSGEIWDRKKGGEVYPKWLSISAVKDMQGSVTHYVGIAADLSRMKQAEEQLQFQAYYDHLTELPNRQLLIDRAQQSIAAASRHTTVFSVLLLDLNDFKKINDSLGHVVGDAVLQEVARRLRSISRKSDTVARLGGDEFVIILNSTSVPDGVLAYLSHLHDTLSVSMKMGGHDLVMTATIGVAVFPRDGATFHDLIKNADAAMYHAKRQQLPHAFFTESLGKQVAIKLDIESRIRTALREGHFRMFYQPKLDLERNRIVGAEALVRLGGRPHSFRTDEIIAVAESTGLIIPLGAWVFQNVCGQVCAWCDAGLVDFKVAINLSVRQLHSKELIGTLREMIRTTGVDPAMLEVEITETSSMMNVESSIAVMRAIRDLGLSISIDDFGTGYSSLSYLRKFPIHCLKIDRSFIADCDRDADKGRIVESIVALAYGMRLRVVAEGVETYSQLEFLRRAGCNEAQGYLIGRPMPPEEVVSMFCSGISPESTG